MTNLTVAILSILLSFEPNVTDTESLEAREARLHTIATAIADTSLRQDWIHANNAAAIQLSLAWHETRFGQKDHEGRCSRSDGCDKGESRTIWQLWQGPWIPKKDQKEMIGTSLYATSLASSWAGTIFRKAYNYCKSYEGAYSLYATGNRCEWEGSAKRVRLHKQILLRISEILKRPNTPVNLSEGFLGELNLVDDLLEQRKISFDLRALKADDSPSVGVVLGSDGQNHQIFLRPAKPAMPWLSLNHVPGVVRVALFAPH